MLKKSKKNYEEVNKKMRETNISDKQMFKIASELVNVADDESQNNIIDLAEFLYCQKNDNYFITKALCTSFASAPVYYNSSSGEEITPGMCLRDNVSLLKRKVASLENGLVKKKLLRDVRNMMLEGQHVYSADKDEEFDYPWCVDLFFDKDQSCMKSFLKDFDKDVMLPFLVEKLKSIGKNKE